MEVKENKSLRGSALLALIVIGGFLWLAVLNWPAVADLQQETHRRTHYVIVVRNTSLKAYTEDYGKPPRPQWIDLIPRDEQDEFDTAIHSIPRELLAAESGKIPLWRKPEPGDLISVVFAAAGKDPKPSGKTGCESPHYPDPSGSDERISLKLDEYFDIRPPIVVEEHDSPSNIADPSSSRLHKKLIDLLAVKDCDLIANAYSEALTLAKGLAAVETGDANGEEKYEQFFLLVFDFASPAYGSSLFNANFEVSREDPAPGTPAYLIAPIGALKFDKGGWIPDPVNYLDYPAKEPGGGTTTGDRDTTKFYPRLRFYRAVAHEAKSDPFYDLADSRRETKRLNSQVAEREQRISQLEKGLKEAGTTALVAKIAAAIFALLMVLVTTLWWTTKGRFRRGTEEYQKGLQRMREEQSRLVEEFREKQTDLEARKEKLKSILIKTISIPDVTNTN
jgi:hypothetical protein